MGRLFTRQVMVRILRAIPSGLLGETEEGRRAIVRQREIAWGEPHPFDLYIGKALPAVVIGHNPEYDELELSLRLAEWDPWDQIETRYSEGAAVTGQVVGCTASALFIELEPGVEAMMAIEDTVADTSVCEASLWIGDHVLARIVRIDTSRRRMRLSLRSLLAERQGAYERSIWDVARQQSWEPAMLAELLTSDQRQKLRALGADLEDAYPIHTRTLHALIIEDDHRCAEGLARFFERNGCRPQIVEAWCKLRLDDSAYYSQFDLAVIDSGFAGMQDAETIGRLRKNGFSAPIVLMSESARCRDTPLWETLREHDAFLVPKSRPEDLDDFLLATLRDLRDSDTANLQTMSEPAPPNMSALIASEWQGEESGDIDKRDLKSELERLRTVCNASTVTILHLNPASGRLQTEEYVGEPFLVDRASPDIVHSPLGDVLIKRKPSIASDISLDSVRFRRLLVIAPFSSFIGLPLPYQQGPERYGLILLGSDRSTTHDRLAAWNACVTLAELLQRRHLERLLGPFHAQRIAGVLAGGLIHEIDNKLYAIHGHAQNLLELIREIRRSPARAEDPAIIDRMSQSAEMVEEARREATELRSQYVGLPSRGERVITDLRELVQLTAQMVRPEASAAGISLDLRLPERAAYVDARRGDLGQIFLNLLLNALQHMVQIKRRGRIVAELSVENDMILMRVTDEGPGMHHALWEHIFDLGFTTRPDGAGIGLTLSRQLARGLGGDVLVEKSYMLWGTTFLWTLPKGERDGNSDSPASR